MSRRDRVERTEWIDPTVPLPWEAVNFADAEGWVVLGPWLPVEYDRPRADYEPKTYRPHVAHTGTGGFQRALDIIRWRETLED